MFTADQPVLHFVLHFRLNMSFVSRLRSPCVGGRGGVLLLKTMQCLFVKFQPSWRLFSGPIKVLSVNCRCEDDTTLCFGPLIVFGSQVGSMSGSVNGLEVCCFVLVDVFLSEFLRFICQSALFSSVSPDCLFLFHIQYVKYIL